MRVTLTIALSGLLATSPAYATTLDINVEVPKLNVAEYHRLSFNDKQPALKQLAPGNYTLVVEAVREVGGRELLKIPFTWPATAAQNGRAQGATELGQVTLAVKP